jgi:ECF sigma factor
MFATALRAKMPPPKPRLTVAAMLPLVPLVPPLAKFAESVELVIISSPASLKIAPPIPAPPPPPPMKYPPLPPPDPARPKPPPPKPPAPPKAAKTSANRRVRGFDIGLLAPGHTAPRKGVCGAGVTSRVVTAIAIDPDRIAVLPRRSDHTRVAQDANRDAECVIGVSIGALDIRLLTPHPVAAHEDISCAGESRQVVGLIAVDSGGITRNDVLLQLAKLDPRQSQIVELRFFGGLTLEETGEFLGVSSDTVTRDWNMAKAWLYRQING